jgi:hypothetical protein
MECLLKVILASGKTGFSSLSHPVLREALLAFSCNPVVKSSKNTEALQQRIQLTFQYCNTMGRISLELALPAGNKT